MNMKKPNIVLILADDMGYGDISHLNEESKINTVNIDKIAREGKSFTDAHAASAVCTPSRYSLLTGRYCWRGKLKRGVLFPFAGPLMEKELPTLPQKLKSVGYKTACFGKWHLGMDYPFANPQDIDNPALGDEARQMDLAGKIDYSRPIENGPNEYGFDYYFGVDVPNYPPYCFIENNHTVGIPDRLKPDSMFGNPGSMLEGWDLERIMPVLTDKVISYIEESDGEKPFFLYFPMTGPQTPISPIKEFIGKSGAGIYGDYCLQLDDTIGRVNRALIDKGIESDTILIITSDNGSPGRDGNSAGPGTVKERYGHDPSWILRGMKGDIHEGGHRIPFIIKWPGRIKENSKDDRLICLMDLISSLSSFAGYELNPEIQRDCLDLSPYFLDEGCDDVIRETLIHHSVRGLYAYRSGKWKLIFGTGSGGFTKDPVIHKTLTIYDEPGQLYDLENDISEKDNLYGCFPDLVGEMDIAHRMCIHNKKNGE